MKKVTISISTGMVGSTRKCTFEIEDDELEGLSELQINDYMLEALWNSDMIHWDYKIED